MKVKSLNVTPNLPESIAPLCELSMNLWSSWNWDVAQLFIRLDAEIWEECRQNLVMTLGRLPKERIEEVAKDDSFIANLNRVWSNLQSYLQERTWFEEQNADAADMKIAYFSMEFGLDVGLPIYSGGLGILAGDHLKSSSDLGVPLVGVGLLYQKGYFQQNLNSDGWQMESYPVNDWYNMPVNLQKDHNGEPILISVDLAGEILHAQIWKVLVGRISLYLLDTNIQQNLPYLREITMQLYGGDRENRIRQEVLLGVGGVRALKALGIIPTVFHINEGHAAFLLLERIHNLMTEENLSFQEAREIVWASTVFTTHTPVPAGNETFTHQRLQRYFGTFADKLGLTWHDFLELGTEPGNGEIFSMTVLALKLAAHCNGVSKLHGKVSRKMWRKLWKDLPLNEIPIRSVTNGVHTRSWLSHDFDELMTRYIGPQFIEEPHNNKLWERVEKIPDIELWRTHIIRKERLIFFARKRLGQQLRRHGAGMSAVQKANEVLRSDALTIGFARRFATYKRANLILRDPERLIRLLTDTKRPIQFIFSGKAHPHDDEGKEFIRKLVHFCKDSKVRERFVFIEDYDINVARYLVQGVDVWLANPLRPLEASGTSGMKVIANGGLNVSTLDGWWAEAYNPAVGWAIGSGETDDNKETLDRIESEALYNLLEQEILPLFYDQDTTGLPRRWIAMMKRSMIILGQYFNTDRMIMEYVDGFYLPAYNTSRALRENNFTKAKSLVEWRNHVTGKWSEVSIISEEFADGTEIRTNQDIPIKARVVLNGISQEDVAVEVLIGVLDPNGEIFNGEVLRLNHEGEVDGATIFGGILNCSSGGRHGYAVRVRPNHSDLVHPYTPLLMKWET